MIFLYSQRFNTPFLLICEPAYKSKRFQMLSDNTDICIFPALQTEPASSLPHLRCVVHVLNLKTSKLGETSLWSHPSSSCFIFSPAILAAGIPLWLCPYCCAGTTKLLPGCSLSETLLWPLRCSFSSSPGPSTPLRHHLQDDDDDDADDAL